MEFGSCSVNMLLSVLCALSLLMNSVNTETVPSIKHDETEKGNTDVHATVEKRQGSLTRRQDGSLLNYFVNGNRQQQPQQSQQHASIDLQQLRNAHSQLTPQQQQLVQQLLQQQLLQQQQAARSNYAYQDNTAQHQQQVAVMSREGGYGGGYDGGYGGQNKQIGISIGGGKLGLGSILRALPRILGVLNGGGKVMMGVELGNNFYFGPVGAKPLYH